MVTKFNDVFMFSFPIWQPVTKMLIIYLFKKIFISSILKKVLSFYSGNRLTLDNIHKNRSDQGLKSMKFRWGNRRIKTEQPHKFDPLNIHSSLFEPSNPRGGGWYHPWRFLPCNPPLAFLFCDLFDDYKCKKMPHSICYLGENPYRHVWHHLVAVKRHMSWLKCPWQLSDYSFFTIIVC